MNIKPLLGDDFALNIVEKKGGDLGHLAGVQFDSDKRKIKIPRA